MTSNNIMALFIAKKYLVLKKLKTLLKANNTTVSLQNYQIT